MRIRSQLGLGEGGILVYAGSLGSWYLFPEMMSFFVAARDEIPGLKFLVLTPHVEQAQQEVERRQCRQDVFIRCLPPSEVPQHLAAADAGICFLSNCLSKQASSPTKYAEYLAVGLPIVTDAWTGDAAQFSDEDVWIQIRLLEDKEYRKAARDLQVLLSRQASTRQAAKQLAGSAFSLGSAIQKYQQLYEEVEEGLPC